MAIPNWGNLAKSQTDSETIEEAIDRLTAAHNDDAGSHLEVGQSLQSHKAEAIIDHQIGSVVADKMSKTEGIYDTTFDSLDNWSTKISAELADWPGVKLYVEQAAVPEATLMTTVAWPEDFFTADKDILFQFTGYFSSSVVDDADHFANFGFFTSKTNILGIGFSFKNGVVKGYVGHGTTIYETDAIDILMTGVHVYRAQVNSGAGTITFYVDGALVGTISIPWGASTFEAQVEFKSYSNSIADGYFFIHKLAISRQI